MQGGKNIRHLGAKHDGLVIIGILLFCFRHSINSTFRYVSYQGFEETDQFRFVPAKNVTKYDYGGLTFISNGDLELREETLHNKGVV